MMPDSGAALFFQLKKSIKATIDSQELKNGVIIFVCILFAFLQAPVNKMRPLQKVLFGLRSRKAIFFTTGILRIFRGQKIEPDNEIEPKRAYCRVLKIRRLEYSLTDLLLESFTMAVTTS